MHITLEADYAVRIVIFLARAGKRMEANKISEGTGVSLRFSLKILRNLVSSTIVKSYKGTNGGYELNKAPEDITMREMLEAIEGEYVFSRCIRESNECTNPESSRCKVKKVFAEITMTVRNKLESITVADMM